MSEIKIPQENALKAYEAAPAKLKPVLEILFGKENLKPKNILERVRTLEDACKETGHKLPNTGDPIEDAEISIKIFAKALREGKHESECYYYPYFSSSSGGFSFHVFGYDYDASHVRARLRVDTSEKAKHLGKCMESYYKTFLTGK